VAGKGWGEVALEAAACKGNAMPLRGWLGLAGRLTPACAVEQDCSLKQAAARFSVSPATACRWSRRWREASGEERRSL
jgi:hypothetical protein